MSLCVRSKFALLGPRAAPLGAVYSARNKGSSLGTKGTRLELLRKGTGGRSSFNGIIATIFGSNGFLARYVINALGQTGAMMVLPHRCDPYLMMRLKVAGDLGQIQFHFFDLRDEKSIAAAMQYSNVVINLIGKDQASGNFSLDDVHVKGARSIARLARESGVEKLIHFSALNAAEKPEKLMFAPSKFFSTKWEGEQVVREEFPDAIVFRPSDMYGHEDRFVRYYSGQWRCNYSVMPLWKGGRKIYKAPVFVGDVARAVVEAINQKGNEGETYQAVGPKLYELRSLMRYISQLLEREMHLYDLRFDPLFMAKISYAELFKNPKMSWERLRREHTSDTIYGEIKTIEDLGVRLTEIEDRFPFEFQYFRVYQFEDPLSFRPNFVEPPPAIRY
ncbi:NADH dehydrogenase [ubiquinone] 1 alpha subcomplex subunit 9, mitochondrial [Galendromus occidentalis]|uniref:NADH dehydrogenase [ubiquinone] 1 alpha subcomplex subunit 9, mitochondrial n=1 Tax=Galendromus occidentalis TaxID=34638 RepID=A0AAJ6QX94_9ACAR|nr:NADH dehydrogenase [ubiquinone] 1 alpha subcomplex subunit 9, mitochondrial [Galendromus occidentalis]